MKHKLFIIIIMITTIVGCSIKKDQHGGSGSSAAIGSGPTVDPETLAITERDWTVDASHPQGIDRTIRTLRNEKLNYIRRSFRVPNMNSVTIPESNGFELYRASGFRPLEGKVFIHPKVFVSSSTDRGSILGYRSGERDEHGQELITISVPVALVDGLVNNIPLIGGATSGASAAIQLPDKYKIPDPGKLREKVSPAELETLPTCPQVFRLSFEGREYRALSPFRNLSVCPINQFFRIEFKAPTNEMRRLLETAALQDEAVTIVTDLSVEFSVPRRAVNLSIPPASFKTVLDEKLQRLEVKEINTNGENSYTLQDIESTVVDSIFQITRTAGVEPEYSEGMSRHISSVIDGYFGSPFSCQRGGICRTPLRRPIQRTNVLYSWTEAENLATPIETQAVTSLGAVANSSEFMAKPARSVFDLAQKPPYFRGKTMPLIVQECASLAAGSYPQLPGMGATERPYIEGYCRGVLAHAVQNQSDPEETDGYFPLGSNTTVYPGAWLKIDLQEVSEFTTAKTKTDRDGNVVIESEIKDLLSDDPNARRTTCTEGNQVACERYAMKQIPVRDSHGDQLFSDQPCRRGEPDCSCQTTNGNEVCTKRQYQFQSVMDYECDAADLFSYCPYYRTQEDIIDYEYEWECHIVKVEERSRFLCIGGCSERSELRCEKKNQRPIKAQRQHLNCREDDPAMGTATRVQECRHPRYICEQWMNRCTRYAVNEAFHIIHEEIAPKWRPFAIQRGEYPRKFEDQIYLKFVSPRGTVTDCRLDRFGRIFRGNTLYIKIPNEDNDTLPCGGPLWNEENKKALFLPKVYLKDDIHYSEARLCGRTEYSFITRDIPVNGGRSVVPTEFRHSTQVNIGPVANSCRAENPVRIGADQWFQEVPPIRFAGRVSVLGRVLESIVTTGGGR